MVENGTYKALEYSKAVIRLLSDQVIMQQFKQTASLGESAVSFQAIIQATMLETTIYDQFLDNESACLLNSTTAMDIVP